MIEVDVFVPLYNAECFVENLVLSIKRQKNVKLNKILFGITESTDNTLNIVKKYQEDISYFVIKKKEFSHSITREKGMSLCNSSFVIMLTQDVLLEDEFAFFNFYSVFNIKLYLWHS